MVRKIYAAFYLKYISNPFSVKIWCKVVFVNPDAYYGTRVLVNKSRMVRKIYAAFYLKYISNPFSVKIWCKVVFVNPDAYYGTQVQVNKKPHCAQDLRCVLFKLYINDV